MKNSPFLKNPIPENTINERLRMQILIYQKNNKISNLDDIFYLIKENTDISYDTIRRYYYGRGKKPLEENKEAIERISAFLVISPDILINDYERFSRTVLKAELEANGEKSDLTEKERLEYYTQQDQDISLSEVQELESELKDLKEKIYSKLIDMDSYKIYLLNKFFKQYVSISDDNWNFLWNYSLLNPKGKKLIEDYLHQIQTPINEQLSVFCSSSIDKISFYAKMRDNNMNEFNEDYNTESEKLSKIQQVRDEKMKDEVLSRLTNKLNSNDNYFTHVERFFNRMDYVTSMEQNDWGILLLLELVPSFSINFTMLIAAMESICSNELYNDNIKFV